MRRIIPKETAKILKGVAFLHGMDVEDLVCLHVLAACNHPLTPEQKDALRDVEAEHRLHRVKLRFLKQRFEP